MTGPSLLRGALRLADAGRLRLTLSLAAGLVAACAGVALLAVSGYLISRAAERPAILTLTVAIVAVRTLAIVRAAARYAERLLSHDVALGILARTRRTVFARLVPLVPGGLRRMRGGDLLGRLVDDVDQLQHLYVSGLGPPLVAAGVTAGAAGAAYAMHPPAGVLLLVILVSAAVVLPAGAALAARRAGRREAPARAALASEVLESVQAAPEIAAYGLADRHLARVRAADAALARITRGDAAVAALGGSAVAALAGLAAAAMLWVCAPAVHDGGLDGVLLAALALLALGAVDALAPLPDAARRLTAILTAAGRVAEITSTPPPVRDPADPLPVGPAPALALEGARLAYPDGPPVLDGADLRLPAGGRVALVGPSGAGKTSIAEVLVRFRDLDGGRATLDGEDLRRYAQDDVRHAVRLCEQDAHLFTGTVRDNVLIGRPDATDAEARAALGVVGLGPWLADLPAGLDTSVGEAGAEVSGGERSRIALARTVLSDAPVLVLDEPTAHLDATSARRLVGDLLDATAGRAILLITHSRIGLDAFDQVLELRDGHIHALPRTACAVR
ncbi:MAG: thiol reductant ABC exporter subunit CydC [Thermoleophilia bacterium]